MVISRSFLHPFLRYGGIFWLLLMMSALSHSAMTAQVNTYTASKQDTLTLTLKIDQQVGFDGPDLTPLEQDFTVLSQQRSNQFRSLNGNIESFTQWKVFMTPKRLGKITIPSIQIGQERSNPISIEVKPLSESVKKQMAQEFFFESSVNQTSAYVQEQIIYTEKLYFTRNHVDARLSEFVVPNAIVQSLGEPKVYTTYIDDKPMGVSERRYAIFPEQSGPLTIPASQFNARRISTYGTVRAPIEVRSNPITLNIKPIPSTYPKNVPWLAATHVNLIQTLSHQKDQWVQGEPVTMTLTLVANGLTGKQLPAIALPNVSELKYYPDQNITDMSVSAQGIQGTREQSLAIVPTSSGKLTFPAIRIPWWNVNTQTLEYATTSAFSINVAQETKVASTHEPMAPKSIPTPKVLTKEPAASTSASDGSRFDSALVWLIGAVIVLTISQILTLIWMLRRKGHTAQAAKASASAPAQPSLSDIKRAAKHGDMTAFRQALLAWAQTSTLTEMAHRIGNRELTQQLKPLDAYLFGTGSKDDIDTGAIIGALKTSSQPHTKPTDSPIDALYS